jgi:hypothetical protein
MEFSWANYACDKPWQFLLSNHTKNGSLRLPENWAETPLCVVTHSPKLVQHANSLRVICRRIASTACGRPQAPFFQVSPDEKLKKIGLHGANPPDPLAFQKSVIAPREFLIFETQKNYPDTDITKSSKINGRNRPSNGKQRKANTIDITLK